MRPARPVLRDTGFLRFWAGTTASGLATWALPFVLGLAVVQGPLSAVGLGLALGVRTAGFLAAMPAGGVLADRYSRRTTVAWSGALAAIGSAATALALTRPGGLLLLLAGCALAGAGQGACRPAFQALLTEIVSADQRQEANAAMTFAVRGTTLLAPALTALAATVLPVAAVMLAITLLWIVAAAVPGPGTHRPMPPDPRAGFVAEFTEGLIEARRHPWFLAGLGALTAVIATGYSATAVALPLVSADTYGGSAALAAALTGYTAGALAGALIIARWRPVARGRIALAGLAAYTVAPLSLMTPLPLWIMVAAFVLCGIGIELFNVPWFTAVQREVEPAKLARVSSVDFLFSYGLAPVGLAVIAPAIEQFGLRPVLTVCAATCLLGPGLAMLAPGARRFSRESAAAS